MSDKKSKPNYHVIVFGRDPHAEEEKKKHTFDGELHVFEFKAQLGAWLNDQHVGVHENDALAGECMLQLPDGRAAMIVKGSRQVLKTTVSVR